MLLLHFSGGMILDTLDFALVRSDDPLVTKEHYLDIPPDALPEQIGDNPWWQVLPPSGNFLHFLSLNPSFNVL
jgi:hypothetical protein